jgi:predicted naringenin-chalcone synthase
MKSFILAIATAVPPYALKQQEIACKMCEMLSLNAEEGERLKKLYRHSAIETRHTVLSDFLHPRSDWNFFGKDYPKSVPGMGQRNDVYKEVAPKLAAEVAQKAIKAWGGRPEEISHVISISCTGMVAPGIEFDLIEALHLNPAVFRLGINFMGCFGMFKGLAVANAFAKENPRHRILLVSTELCSLHFQSDLDIETLTANAIFSDGAAAVIVGGPPQPNEKPLWSIDQVCSLAMENSKSKMSWEAGDRGFLIGLSYQVPVLIGRKIKSFTETILGANIRPCDCDWAIHPGGKSILQAVEKAMQLEKHQTEASWKTFAHYGNMSSATLLFVLDQQNRQKTSKEWTLAIGFGPGLSMEGLLLRRSCDGAP